MIDSTTPPPTGEVVKDPDAAPHFHIGPWSVGPWMMAPMAGFSEAPFRQIVLEMGCGLAPTELVSADAIVYVPHKQGPYVARAPNERPFAIQLFGYEPEKIAHAAEWCVANASANIIDINMGCPVPKVVKKGGGAALMQEPERAAAIVTAIKKRVDVPVTCKFRAGWDAEHVNAIEFAKALEGAGAAMVALHARTRAAYHKGQPDWGLIRKLKNAVGIPVVGNGNALDWHSARRMMAETGCDGVMVARGAIGNPWVFAELSGQRPVGPVSPLERLPVVQRHLKMHVEYCGDELSGVRSFRAKLMAYARGLPGAAQFREQACHIDAVEPLVAHIQNFFETTSMPEESAYDTADGISLDWSPTASE
jgi:tRNA-dihydrouridine synthase B